MAHGAFADALLTLPNEWQEDLKKKRLASVPVLANATNEELEEAIGYVPKQVWNLVYLARTLEKIDIRSLGQNGLGVIPRKTRDFNMSVVINQHRKPLKLPKKNPPILPKGPLVGSTDKGENPKKKAQDENKESALNCIWATFLDLGNCGTMWTQNFEKTEYLSESKEVVTDGWVENTALIQHLNTLELWRSFSEEVKNKLENAR